MKWPSFPNSDSKNNYKLTTAGYSVLEMVNAFEKATGQKVPYELSDRRPGDVASAYASTDLAEKELGWKSRLGIEDMCKLLFQNLMRICYQICSFGRSRHVDVAVEECKRLQTRPEAIT